MDITKIYGTKVFSDAVMSQRLPKDVYESLKLTQKMGTELDSSIAGTVAAAMLDWAVENGATHYMHWFQPIRSITAGKRESFIMPENNNGNVILQFSANDLIQSEPDASSRVFPSCFMAERIIAFPSASGVSSSFTCFTRIGVSTLMTASASSSASSTRSRF